MIFKPNDIFNPSFVEIRFFPNYYNQKGQKCIDVLKTFRYESKNGQEWIVPKGFQSDAASIPKWAQKFIGEPLEGDTLRAVLIHDVYCAYKTRSQEDTHKVFREIMKHDGVNLVTRNLMYQAVKRWNKFKNPDWE